MFTGLIEEIGTVTAVTAAGDGIRLTVRAPGAAAAAQHGDSISVSGVCLTVIDQGADSFSTDVIAQTLRMSALASAGIAQRVNIEQATAVGTRLGGHIVQGHVDGTATVLQVRPGDQWRTIRFALSRELASLVVDKGSIAIDGVSLTVSGISEAADPRQWFEVSLIPETLTATTLGQLTGGDVVNIETDILARHVQRLLAFESRTANTSEEVA